ncbi:hypothetical protein C8R42DRAFT_754999 [Lentinula raphanica]|nr:hypothetical protein C8R42DRAFT_754999 [Lentinula raphanica]
MDSCDLIKLDGSPVASNKERSTYTTAQKMRAAATFGFGRMCGLGNLAWHRSEFSGQMLGNPSVSETVSSYMLSLRRRKVDSGETPTSARAVSADLLKQLYYFNTQPQFRKPQPHQPTTRGTRTGGELGCRARTMLILAYNIAFCGLLRVDELLKIQFHDVQITKDPKTGLSKLTLTLPFQKTSQFGDIKPFVWYSMPYNLRHICIVSAFARWITVSGLSEGYMFRKVRSGDSIAEGNEPMASNPSCYFQ